MELISIIISLFILYCLIMTVYDDLKAIFKDKTKFMLQFYITIGTITTFMMYLIGVYGLLELIFSH